MKKLLKIAVCLLMCAVIVMRAVPYVPAASGFYDTAELLSILSHIEYDAGMSQYATVQGACTDGRYAYFAVQNGSTVILKYDMSTWTLSKKATVGGLGHANDMAYNPNGGFIVVANNNSSDDCLTLINPDSLSVIRTVVPRVEKTKSEIENEAKKKKVSSSKIEKYKDLKLYSIAYNSSRNTYIAGVSGSYDYVLLDSAFEQTSRITGVSTGLTRQGIDCDDDYIYFAQSGGSNAVTVYNYSGSKVGMVSLNHSHEVENIFHVGNSFYVTLHYYGNSVQRVGLSDKTKICFTVRYDANGGDGSMPDTSVHYGEEKKLSKCSFTRPGYFFGGWRVRRTSDSKHMGYRLGSSKGEWLNSADTYNNVLLSDEQKVSKLTKFGEAVLSAFWINESYTVCFDSDGGEGSMEPMTAGYYEELALPENSFVRHGYVFSGYTATRECDGRAYGFRKDSDKPEWLEPDDVNEMYVFDAGDTVTCMTYDMSVLFTAQFTYAFVFNDEMDTLTKYVGVDERVDIPDASGKLSTIASGAFEEVGTMTELVVPASVDRMESGAVKDCSSLREIYFVGGFPKDFDNACVTDSGAPTVYTVRDGRVLCLGFYADLNCGPAIYTNAMGLEKNYKAPDDSAKEQKATADQSAAE